MNVIYTQKSRIKNQKSNQGFTLVELMIVIGIIVVLVGIITVAVNVIGNDASTRQTRVAIETAMGMQQEYENTTTLSAGLKVNANATLLNDSGTSSSNTIFTQRMVRNMARVPANRQAVEKMSTNTVARISAVEWNSSVTYVSGDVITHASLTYNAIASSLNQAPPNTTFWNTTSTDLSNVIVPLDGWQKQLRYVGATLTNVTTDVSGTQTLRPNVTSPTGRPFWFSAGPDADYTTHDDNVYSFEN